MSESKRSSILYINKWIVMLIIIVTTSVGFFLGFIVGKNYNKNQYTITPTNSLDISSMETIKPKHSEVQKFDSTYGQNSKELKSENFKEETTEQQVKTYYQDRQDKATKETNSYKKYSIQVGAFQNEVEAIALKTKLKKKGYNASISLNKTNNNGKLYKVKVGEFVNKEDAENFCNKLKRNEGIKAFVTIK